MDISKFNPESAFYKCDAGCGCCCRHAAPAYAAEAVELSEKTGIEFQKLVHGELLNELFILRDTSTKDGCCIFLSKGNECIIHEAEYRPLRCRLYPLQFSMELSPHSMEIYIDRHKICLNMYYAKRSKRLTKTKVKELAVNAVMLNAVHNAVRLDGDGLFNFAQRARDLYRSLSLQDAVDMLLKEGKTRVIE